MPENLKAPIDYPDPLAEVSPQLWAVYLVQDVVLYSRASRPNLVRRFFLWAFFGWRWVPLKKDRK